MYLSELRKRILPSVFCLPVIESPSYVLPRLLVIELSIHLDLSLNLAALLPVFREPMQRRTVWSQRNSLPLPTHITDLPISATLSIKRSRMEVPS